MNKYRKTAMLTAVTLAGLMQSLAAQETIDVTPAGNTPPQVTSEQKPPAEAPAPVASTPAQALAQSNDKLLSEMKVYPSF